MSAGRRWREDESNQDRTIPRNKVRHELLPWLVEAFGAGVVDVLARQAALSRDDAEWFELVATETADRLVIEDGTIVTLEQGALGALHPAIGRRVVLGGAAGAAPKPGGSSGSITSKRCWRSRQAGSGAIDVPGQRVECRQGRLRFEPRTPDPGREGRRRGRPVPDAEPTAEPIGGSAVSNSAGDRPGADRRRRRVRGRDGTTSRRRAEVRRKC